VLQAKFGGKVAAVPRIDRKGFGLRERSMSDA
jgi:hypothetical protein